MRWMALALALAILGLAAPDPGSAQEGAERRTRAWVAVGPGFAAMSQAEPEALLAQLVVQRGPHHLAIRGLGLEELGSSGTMSASEVGVVYGRVRRGWLGHVLAAAGVASVSCSDPFNAEVCDGQRTLGVPFVGEAALRLGSVAGLGLQAFGNLNPRQSYGGAALFLQLGWNP